MKGSRRGEGFFIEGGWFLMKGDNQQSPNLPGDSMQPKSQVSKRKWWTWVQNNSLATRK